MSVLNVFLRSTIVEHGQVHSSVVDFSQFAWLFSTDRPKDGKHLSIILHNPNSRSVNLEFQLDAAQCQEYLSCSLSFATHDLRKKRRNEQASKRVLFLRLGRLLSFFFSLSSSLSRSCALYLYPMCDECNSVNSLLKERGKPLALNLHWRLSRSLLDQCLFKGDSDAFRHEISRICLAADRLSNDLFQPVCRRAELFIFDWFPTWWKRNTTDSRLAAWWFARCQFNFITIARGGLLQRYFRTMCLYSPRLFTSRWRGTFVSCWRTMCDRS